MATTHTLGRSRVGDPSGWNRILIGMAVGALCATLIAGWLANRDTGVESASAVGTVSAYTLGKVLEVEDADSAGSAGSIHTSPARLDYSHLKAAQARTSGIAVSSAYTMSKVEQAQNSGAGEAIAAPASEVGPDPYSLYKLDQTRGSASKASMPQDPNLDKLVQ